MGKGDHRRPEAVKGAWDQNWRRVFGRTEAEVVAASRARAQREAEERLEQEQRGAPCS